MVTRRRVLAGLLGGATVGSVGVTALGLTGTSGERTTALVAGSLLGVAEAVPGASVEAHGSAAVRQLIRSGARAPDAVAVADPRLLAGVHDTGRLFATNALVIAYHPDSAYAGELQSDWASAIEAEGIRMGRTDPETDPLGYRTVMALRLAERYGVDATAVREASTIHPETEITNLVERGDLDCAFVYASMAIERDLPAVDLPTSVDFSSPARADHYATVSVTIDGRQLEGAPIRYAAAALTEGGRSWVTSLVTGRERLEEHGFTVPEKYPVSRRIGD